MSHSSACRRPAIHVHEMRFSFGAHPVLTGIDVDIEWGRVTAIIGPNGAGKSTLLEVLAGVKRPTSGTVQRVSTPALVVQRPASPETLPLTVRGVVTMGTWARPDGRRARLGRQDRLRRVERALERVELADLAERPFATLSGGQRQRALIAQGLARHADIFLLDEPAAGLDAVSRERTRQILAAEAGRGAAVVCVTHDEADISAADAVIELDGGEIVTRASRGAPP